MFFNKNSTEDPCVELINSLKDPTRTHPDYLSELCIFLQASTDEKVKSVYRKCYH